MYKYNLSLLVLSSVTQSLQKHLPLSCSFNATLTELGIFFEQLTLSNIKMLENL